MKLCRFEDAASPGQVRSGIVYGGKVYETDGAKAIAVHETAEVRLLTPIGRPASVRFFWCYEAPPVAGASLESQLDFVYLNPSCLVPPVSALKKPVFAGDLSFDPCVAVVIAAGGSSIPPENAEEHILGFMLGVSFADESIEGPAFGVVRYSARRRDIGTAVGPAITTPDEMEDAVIEHGAGTRYQAVLSAKVNGRDVGAWNLAELPVSLSEVVSQASESCPLVEGDLICIAMPTKDRPAAMSGLDRGDEVQVVCDRLGSLTTVIA